jgi:integrase/recombinase XerD
MLEVTKTQLDFTGVRNRSLVALVMYLSKRKKLFGKEELLFLPKQGKPLTLRMTNKTIERIGEKASIQNVRLSAHTFRHSFAKSWPFSLQRVLGHTTLDMVKNYVNMTYRDIQSQHSKFSPGDNLNF